MGTFRFSRLAEADLLSIGVYTLRTWGDAQAVRYVDELEGCCQHLVNSPMSGRSCDYVRPGLYRMEAGKHVIFFRREPTGTLVFRILHERMVLERHVFDDEQQQPLLDPSR